VQLSVQSVVPLTTQYRMAEDIQLIANTLIYNGRLQCGSSQVGGATLFAQIPPHLLGCYPSWLLQVSTDVPTLITLKRLTMILIDHCWMVLSWAKVTSFNQVAASVYCWPLYGL